jgi:hypothetical protein
MKLTLGQLVDAAKPLENLGLKDIPIITARKLLKAIDLIQPELKIVDQMRQKLFAKYGSPDGKGGLEIQPDNFSAFNKEWQKLCEETVELNIPEITLDELGNVSVKPMDLYNLKFLVKE